MPVIGTTTVTGEMLTTVTTNDMSTIGDENIGSDQKKPREEKRKRSTYLSDSDNSIE